MKSLILLAGLAIGARGAESIAEKTLVVWAAPSSLANRGGSALTIEKSGGASFDAIVFGELSEGKWMPGSDGFSRTKQDQAAFPQESSTETTTQIAIVYRGKSVSLYRNGQEVTAYQTGGLESFPADSAVLMGLRHTGAGAKNRYFVGSIDDARIYNIALSPEQIRNLKANQSSEPKPFAWWDFEEGRANDRIGNFAETTLLGEARIHDGRLRLDKEGACLRAEKHAGALSGNNPDEIARALRERLLSDPHRPGYHFVIPEGTGMPFDPNGAIFWKGRYHLFYIFQDKRGHNWGHVSSADLFHWRHHPTGLVEGMFSGNAFINKEGVPTICYHQVDQGNAMAVALDDELNTWKKLESNPITPKTKPGDPHHGKYRSWDPFGWIEGDTYYAIFGGEHPGLVKAPTLGGEWKYVGDFLANTVPGVSINEDISCADFFKLGGKHVLVCISHRLGARYYVGDWKNEQFHPTFHEKMSWVDNSFFAPETLLDDRGRRILWAWIFDKPQFKMRTDHGWSGAMSLPRVLTLGSDGILRMNPPEEIERLRQQPRHAASLRVEPGRDLVLDGIQGNSLELEVEINPTQASQFGVKVCLSPNGEEQTRIYYDATDKKLKIDTTKSGGDSPSTIEGGPLNLVENEPLKLRIFVDKSVVEVFANEGRQAVMRRIYPARPDSLRVALFSAGSAIEVPKVHAWQLAPSNPF